MGLIEKYQKFKKQWNEFQLYRNQFEDDKDWKPKTGDTIYYLNYNFDVQKTEFKLPFYDDIYKTKCFYKSEERAKSESEFYRALSVLRKDSNYFVPKDDAYFIAKYDPYLKKLESVYVVSSIREGVVCFEDRDECDKSIKKHRKQWLTILGVKND